MSEDFPLEKLDKLGEKSPQVMLRTSRKLTVLSVMAFFPIKCVSLVINGMSVDFGEKGVIRRAFVSE